MSTIRMAQYGTKHGHAGGVLSVMLANPDVEVAGVYEPDLQRRRELQSTGVPPWSKIEWIENETDLLGDNSIIAVSSEGSNMESLKHTEQIIDAGKHVFYDKPAGDDYSKFHRIVQTARKKKLLVQLGYMFRYHDGFTKIANWARSGFLGDIFAIRAHMSTTMDRLSQSSLQDYPTGGIFYDLGAHMVDQMVWILGRPNKITSFLREDFVKTNGFANNTLGVFEYDNSMAIIDIASMEPAPPARRFEVYGSVGSAIMEPMEPAETLKLTLTEPRGNYPIGVSLVNLEDRPRYVASLEAFVKDIKGEKEPDWSLEHELLVQETLLRATGHIR